MAVEREGKKGLHAWYRCEGRKKGGIREGRVDGSARRKRAGTRCRSQGEKKREKMDHFAGGTGELTGQQRGNDAP